MTRYMTRDRAVILLPWRGSWSNTNVALLLLVVVVAVAAIGNHAAGARPGLARVAARRGI